MRLLFITRRIAPDLHTARATTFAQLVSDARREHDVHVVAGWVHDRTLLPEGTLGVDLCGKRALSAALTFRRAVARAIQQVRPDVVITANLPIPRTSCPVIAVAHHVPDPASLQGRAARSLRGTWLASTVARIVVPGAIGQQRLEALGVPPGHIEVLPYGIDTQRFAPAAHRPSPDPLRLACVGRMAPDKGQHVAIDAVARLASADKARVHLDVTGTVGDRIYVEHLRAQAWRQPVTVKTDVKDVLPTYQGAHAVIVPTLLDEGFPFAALEAAACGVPVVYASHPRLGEALAGRGIAVPPGDVVALRQVVRDLLAGRPAIDLDAARQRVVDHYDHTVAWARWNALIGAVYRAWRS